MTGRHQLGAWFVVEVFVYIDDGSVFEQPAWQSSKRHVGYGLQERIDILPVIYRCGRMHLQRKRLARIDSTGTMRIQTTPNVVRGGYSEGRTGNI